MIKSNVLDANKPLFLSTTLKKQRLMDLAVPALAVAGIWGLAYWVDQENMKSDTKTVEPHRASTQLSLDSHQTRALLSPALQGKGLSNMSIDDHSGQLVKQYALESGGTIVDMTGTPKDALARCMNLVASARSDLPFKTHSVMVQPQRGMLPQNKTRPKFQVMYAIGSKGGATTAGDVSGKTRRLGGRHGKDESARHPLNPIPQLFNKAKGPGSKFHRNK